ncbi:aldehyde-activating protein [Chitiniphilus shinanonensis]|uniref:Aldehyde-activating protein n=1 Tax=Chitiniphilus shinanonensis TaxID=553088 RepID=A0ABQ6BPF8_9NEIS|nr:GFA family protein [Chitiniphilus shinanonensis]GLS03137.1 aldehyde-activating protein [Chitiniphilus shinanonensis]
MLYHGSCHCGRIAYEVESEPVTRVIECNCSICQRRGHLLFFVPRANLRLSTPEQDITTYTFNAERIRHQFCPVCGCGTFGIGTDPHGNEIAAINARCLEDIDLAALERQPYDGRSI